MSTTEDQVRVIRIYEFLGPRSKVEKQVSMSIHGCKDNGNGVTITAATLGEYPEILARAVPTLPTMKNAYSAYVLTAESRAQLLKRFPPKFPEVIAHHITWGFGADINSPMPIADIKVVGYTSDDGIEAAVVDVGDEYWQSGRGLNRLHVTLSLDRSKGWKPKDSNKIIQAHGWTIIDNPFLIEAKPEVIPL